MDFVAICAAILLWLVRPQDWMSGMAGTGFMTYAMLAALLGLWKRPQGLTLKTFFQSPADYFMVGYLLWIIITTGDYVETAKKVFPLLAFYYTAALALNTPARLKTFLNCWIIGLCVVVTFALSTKYGFELAPGSELLTSYFADRLALNTYIYNNPNSLGHGVVVLIPFAFAWLWMKRSLPIRILGLLVMWGAGYCAYLTQSKGAYICGAAALGAVLLFRKKLVLQVLILAIALTGGLTALKKLPRMDSLSAQEDGIAGRLMIWQMAHNAMVNTQIGEGWKKFEAWVVDPKRGPYRKATHGSYVNVGADLGYPGLFLFVAILYAGARCIWQARPPPDDLVSERNQFGLLALLVGYSASAWMIDRAYHTDYFLLAGTIAAFHRQMVRKKADEEVSEEESPEEAEVSEPAPAGPILPTPAFGWLAPRPAFAMAGQFPYVPGTLPGAPVAAARQFPNAALAAAEEEPEEAKEKTRPLKWRRLGVWDIILLAVSFWAVLSIWEQIMTNFIAF